MNHRAVYIPEKLFFEIGEVCAITGVQAHVLRYWESQFPMLAPQKNRAGQRTYRKRDVEMALRIKELLYEDQYTIADAKKKLTSDIPGASKLKVVNLEAEASIPTTEEESDTLTSDSRSAALAGLREQMADLLHLMTGSEGHSQMNRDFEDVEQIAETDLTPPTREEALEISQVLDRATHALNKSRARAETMKTEIEQLKYKTRSILDQIEEGLNDVA